MKQDFFTAPGLRIQRQCDKWNGPMYLAWKPNVSMCFRDRKALLKVKGVGPFIPADVTFIGSTGGVEQPVSVDEEGH